MTPEHVLDVLTNGSMRSNAAAISDADKRLRSRYPGFQNGQPGNVLLAFAPAVRLDVFADERKKKADGQ
jgi:hypothetical protein